VNRSRRNGRQSKRPAAPIELSRDQRAKVRYGPPPSFLAVRIGCERRRREDRRANLWGRGTVRSKSRRSVQHGRRIPDKRCVPGIWQDGVIAYILSAGKRTLAPGRQPRSKAQAGVSAVSRVAAHE
jgi:hypothetical protein